MKTGRFLAAGMAVSVLVTMVGVASSKPAGATSASYPATVTCNAATNNGICISEVNVDYTATTVSLSVNVGAATDPTLDPNWFADSIPTALGWEIFVNGESTYSYIASLGDSGSPGEFFGGVGPPGSAATCLGGPEVDANYDVAASTYGMSFPASCIGNPASFSVEALWVYEDSANQIQYSASEPGIGAGTCCTVTPDSSSSGTSTTSPAAPTPLASPIVGMVATPDGGGYWLANAAGAVSIHGDAVSYGSLEGRPLNAPITHIVATPDGHGYWLVAADGGTFTFGDAHFYGSMGGRPLNAPVVDIAPTADGGGYWLVASDGGIFAFGDAKFLGSTGGQHLNRPVVGMSPDYATGGYWLVASDGGIFSFGAPFFGSTGALHLNKPINGMAPTPNDQGYWLVASDGGIFSGGNAAFYGSTGSLQLRAPIVGMATDAATGGYWMVASDGGIFSFHAPFFGAD